MLGVVNQFVVDGTLQLGSKQSWLCHRMITFLSAQELAAGADQALMAEQSADQKQLLAGLQKQHDSQAQVMARQAKVAETQV